MSNRKVPNGTLSCPIASGKVLATHPLGLFDPGPVVKIEALGQRRTIEWGRRWQAGTAAYWIASTQYAESDGHSRGPARHRLGASLREEVAACILGGFGMPYEIGLAAFGAVRDSGLLVGGREVCAEEIEQILRKEIFFRGIARKYRFPSQRADRLARCLAFLDVNTPPEHPLKLRDWLLGAPGIGPKTASWVVRNHFDCDEVAILDVHLMRAGIGAGVFDSKWTVAHDYSLIEAFFLEWAKIGNVRASDLDAIIWSEQAMRSRFNHSSDVRAC